MNTIPPKLTPCCANVSAQRPRAPWQWWLLAGLLTVWACPRLAAQNNYLIYSNNFDSYTSYAATNLYDTSYAFPTGAAPGLVLVGNSPYGWPAGSGVQLINWLSHSGTQSLLVRSGCEADINLYKVRSGTSYQLDFWLYVHKAGTNGTAGVRNWYMRPGGEGADNNGDDYIAYRSDRAADDKIYNYGGIGSAAWVYIGASNIEDTWQHHRLFVDTEARTVTIYIDDMSNAVYTGYIARPYVAVPTIWRLQNEGTTANDGWYAIDNISMTVSNCVTVATNQFTFTEGWENYTAGTNPVGGPWITVASGSASGSSLVPSKVQVVDTSTVTPHSGTKCLQIQNQGSQYAGVTLAWGGGSLPQTDMQITWWAMVPSAVGSSSTADEFPLRMSFYTTEGGSPYAGDSADLGYGIRGGIGGPTNLLIYTTTWVNTGAAFTPNTWEEYQLTTYNSLGAYSLVKSPSSANPITIASNALYISSSSTFGPPLMVAFSQSQMTAPAAVYVDDISIKSVTSKPPPPPPPPPSGPYAAAVLSNNPVAYYACQELPGSVILYDSSSSASHNGRWSYDASGSYPALGQPGIGGSSALFHVYSGSGGTPYASAGFYSDLNPTGPFSAECWVNALSAPSTGYRTPAASFNINQGWEFYQGPYVGNGQFQWIWVQEDGSIWLQSAPASVNQWYHLAASYDGTNVSFYVNGQRQGQANATAAPANTSKPVTIGANPFGNGFDGSVCQVALYNTALTPSQIQTDYEVGITNIVAGTNAPFVVIGPVSTTAYSGNPVTFQVEAGGSTPLSYQWYRNNAKIAGGTNSMLQFTCATTDNGASYFAVVSNLHGSVTSSSAGLTVLTGLWLTNSPVSVTREVGSKAAFLAQGWGSMPISYQWFDKNSNPIPGATNQMLWLNDVQPTDDGSTYYAHLADPLGDVTDTPPATLSVVARTVTVPLTRYASVVAADDPVAYWRLDESDSGLPATDAVGSFDGIYMILGSLGGAFTMGVPTGIPNETNVAVAVTNGAVVAVTQPYNPTPNVLELNPYGPFSAEAWLQPASLLSPGDTARTAVASMGNGVGGPIGWNLCQENNNVWTMIAWGDNWNNMGLGANSAIVANNWYYAVVTYDGGLFSLYLNGTLQSSGSYAGYIPNSSGATVLGWWANQYYAPFAGTIDDVAFYNYALTPNQVQAHYLATVRLTVNKLGSDVVLSWPFGTLQQADTVSGPYTDVGRATSPYTNSPTASSSFFRVKAY